MKTRNIVILVIVGFVASCGTMIGGIFYATSGIVDAGDQFFEAARKHDYDAAYALTSEDLKRSQSKQNLQEFIVSGGFDKVVDTSWSSRSFENSNGKLKGSVTTGTGGVIPLTMNLVKENGTWKITYISKRKSGLDSEE